MLYRASKVARLPRAGMKNAQNPNPHIARRQNGKNGGKTRPINDWYRRTRRKTLRSAQEKAPRRAKAHAKIRNDLYSVGQKAFSLWSGRYFMSN